MARSVPRLRALFYWLLALAPAVASGGSGGGGNVAGQGPPRSLRMPLWELDWDGDGTVSLPEADRYARAHGLPLLPAQTFDALLRDRPVPPRVRALALPAAAVPMASLSPANRHEEPYVAISPWDARVPLPLAGDRAVRGAGRRGGSGSSGSVLNARVYDVRGAVLGVPRAAVSQRSGSGDNGHGEDGSNADHAAADETALALFGHAVLSIDGHSCANASAVEVAQRLQRARRRAVDTATATATGGDSSSGQAAVLVLLLDVLRLGAAPAARPTALRQEVLQNFKALDGDRDFTVTPLEWGSAAASFAASSADFQSIDANGSGRLEAAEYLRHFLC